MDSTKKNSLYEVDPLGRPQTPIDKEATAERAFQRYFRQAILVVLVFSMMLFAVGCVDQRAGAEKADAISQSTAVVDNTKDWPQTNRRIVVTSMATVYIMEKLKVDLVGIPSSDIDNVPSAYQNATLVGSAMNPDIEIIRSLEPSYVFSPVSLMADLKPKYDQANVEYGFINLNNVEGMYESIKDLGKLLGREKEAAVLVEEYESFIADFRKRNEDKEKKKVLILMGLPGSYVVATEYSYAGSLVKMAGGENVYTSEGEPFINVNIEDMLQKDPDIILRTAHALPEDVMGMFAKEFKENDNWKHFRAVQENKVYDLDYTKFGMSAKFNYPEALEDLEEILYAS
ncbi:MAG: heme ABC transporter substrate-binding protein IsdE [Peptostreptococcaceae bacterium]|nr:heme ABC transporter substrate-binding protein IsdE [Peptostreptococcaceae bacterium]